MRRTVFVATISSLMLASCGGASDTDTDESLTLEEVAEITKDADIKPLPGQYSVNMEVLEVDIPGAPEGIADMMRNNMGGSSHSYCLSQEDVDNGFEEMAKRSQEGSDCTFDRYDFDGGELDAKMTCDMAGQGSMTMTMNGKGSPTRSEMEMTMEGNMAGMGDSTIRMKATHERTGDCA